MNTFFFSCQRLPILQRVCVLAIAVLCRGRLLRCCMIMICVMSGTIAGGILADETDARRVAISLSIFPRIVAVDNHFREKLDDDRKAYLLFVYDKDEKYAQQISNHMQEDNKNIGGMHIVTKAISVTDVFRENDPPTAIFIVEKLTDPQLNKVMMFADKTHRLVFSPFAGDVERGVTVGISITNRVKPYFNLSTLLRSKVVINALLMKMSKHYE